MPPLARRLAGGDRAADEFQHRHSLFARDAFELVQKFSQAQARLQVLKQRIHRHPRPREADATTKSLRVAPDGQVIFHGDSVSLAKNRTNSGGVGRMAPAALDLAWGNDSFGQATIPSNVGGVIAISASGMNTALLVSRCN